MGVEGGEGESMHRLGNIYHFGNGVDKDEKKAIEYYKMAGEKEHSEYIFRLADILLEGK